MSPSNDAHKSNAARTAPMGARVEERDPHRGLKIGVHSYSLRNFSMEEAIAITCDMGLRYFGANPKHIPIESTRRQIAEARNAMANWGLSVVATGVLRLTRDEGDSRPAFEYAKALGVRVIVCHPEYDSFDTLDRLVTEYDMHLAIHNHGPEGLYRTPDDVVGAIATHDERIGACVDLGHYERAGIRAGDALRALEGRIYDVHLKDVDATDESGQSVVHGTGVVDFEDVFKTLLAMKFPYHVAMEYEADPDDPLPGMKKSLEHTRAVLATL